MGTILESKIEPEFGPFEGISVWNASPYKVDFEAVLEMPFEIVEVCSTKDKFATTFDGDCRKKAHVSRVLFASREAISKFACVCV